MKTILSVILAGMASASFAAGIGAGAGNDNAQYRALTDRAESDYKMAKERCDSLSGNAKDICVEEAKVARSRANADAVAQHNKAKGARTKAWLEVAEAEYELAKERCDDLAGDAKDQCKTSAKGMRTAGIADAKAGREIARITPPLRSGDVMMGTPATPMTARTENMPASRSGETAATVADKTERMAERAADKTEAAADKAGEKIADSVITTKVKADLLREKDLKSTGIHVETVNGVVMLSGFVDSRSEADRAVRVAKGVKGVTEVKSAVKVK